MSRRPKPAHILLVQLNVRFNVTHYDENIFFANSLGANVRVCVCTISRDVNNFSTDATDFIQAAVQIRHVCRLREHLSYIARGMHVFIGVFKIVREQSVAKTVEIRANTRARDMSHCSLQNWPSPCGTVHRSNVYKIFHNK